MSKPKQGKEFEELVTWITRCLHDKAVITPNDKIRDKDSKKLRQVDISLRLKDGPSSFLGIIEVRDRSRPVDETYIEQVSAKCQSVCADAAFIVSASGFYKAAIEKAHALNIRVFTYQEAVASDWAECLQLREISQFLKRWDNVVFVFIDPTINTIINPHESLISAVKKDMNALILLNKHGEPKRSIAELFAQTVNSHIDHFFADTSFTEPKRRRRVVVNVGAASEELALFFRDASDHLRRLEKFLVEADFWVELVKTPVQVSKYFDAKTGKSIAEIASTSVHAWGGVHKLNLIAKFSDEGDTKISLRMHKEESPKENPTPPPSQSS